MKIDDGAVLQLDAVAVDRALERALNDRLLRDDCAVDTALIADEELRGMDLAADTAEDMQDAGQIILPVTSMPRPTLETRSGNCPTGVGSGCISMLLIALASRPLFDWKELSAVLLFLVVRFRW